MSPMKDIMRPVTASDTPVLTLALFMAIAGIVIIVFGVVEFFMNHSMFGLTPANSTIAIVILGAVSILIAVPAYKKMKIGYILAIIYFIVLIAFGILLLAKADTTMFFKFFYILVGIFGLIDILTPKVRKSYF